jgi:apolipoprotein N-acyltransferase
MLKTEWLNLALALLLGAAFPLGFAPLGWWPVSLLSAAGLFLVLNNARRQWLLLAWSYGVGKYLTGASWIYVSIHQYGNASTPLAVGLVGVFVAALALFMLPVGWSLQRFRVATPWVNGLIFCAAWVAVEWLLTWVLSGFPWLFIGYSLTDSPFVGLLPVVGVLSTGLLALLCSVGSVLLLRAAWRSLPLPKAAMVMAAMPIALV